MTKNSAQMYFERYLKVAPLSHALWRSVEAQELGKHKLEKPILDIGCGFGEFGGVFFDRQVEVGVDIDHDEIKRAAQSGKYKKTIVADAHKLPFFDNTFKTVISISTLEHIPDNAKVFKEAFRVLKPGGKFIFMSPTDQLYTGLMVVKFLRLIGLDSLARIYFRVLNKAFKHVYLPPVQKWLERTTKAGFEIEKTYGTLPQITLTLWELGLIPAFPSQLSKMILGRRIVMAPTIKAKLFRPLVRFIRTDPKCKVNIFVLARKPKTKK